MALTVKITNGSGTTDFTCGTIRFSQRSATPVLINGFTVAYQWNYVVEGELINTSTSSVMSDITAFESLVGTMSKIEFDDGSGNVQHSITESNTLTGLQRSLSWLGSDLHLATEAKFQLSLQFMLANTNEEATLLEVSESITIQGEGGAATPLVPQARSAWVYQQTMQYTPVYVVQSGYVVYKGTSTVTLPSYAVATTNARQRQETRTETSYMYEREWIKATKVSYQFVYHLATYPASAITPAFIP